MAMIESTPVFVRAAYDRIAKNLEVVRGRLKRPLTFTEKILLGHLDDPAKAELAPGRSYLYLRPDRVAMQDATAQMAILQFMQSGRPRVAVPTTVHCDHLIQAYRGAAPDLARAEEENKEVYAFLASAAAKYGMGFWRPGSGIIHQVILENYAFPGGMIIGTDSHTPNAGGLGMWASGVGGADAVDVMAGFPWEVLYPKLVGVKLTGKPSGWTSPKDVILKLLGLLTVKGGTNRVIEYFGDGVTGVSCTGKATITNMGAELGATTSMFPFDDRQAGYLRGTGRAELAALAEEHKHLLGPDPEVLADPARYFDQVVEIDLSALEPHVVGPHTPDLARTLGELKAAVPKEGYPDNLTFALVGSCTNSSYEDMGRAAEVARQASARGLKTAVPLVVSPGSERVRATIARDGQMAALEAVGATLLSNSCGPCIGQWRRDDVKMGEKNSIISSFNRNFPKRNDGNAATASFIASPEVVVAYALFGRLGVDPTKDPLQGADGKEFVLAPPPPAPDLPAKGFEKDPYGYVAPAEDPSKVEVVVAPASERLQVLSPFAPWSGEDYEALPVLLKAKGKCTTDHISPAGPWLKYRGHLDKISDNMFTGAVNAFTGESGKGLHPLTGEAGLPYPKIARDLQSKGLRWVAVGDENYGEGSSREHAAMSPRFLGAAAVITRSFARIHESNLKKQGVLPLTFQNPADYEKVQADDRVSLLGLKELAPGKPVTAVLTHRDGTKERLVLNHSLNAEQIGWFKSGSALNTIRG